MLTTYVEISEYNTPTMFVTLGDRKIEFDIHQTTKRATKLEGIYDHINQYQATFSKERAEKIFILIAEASDSLGHDMSSTEYMMYLKGKIKEAVELWNFDEFLIWFRSHHEGLYIPDDMDVDFIDEIDNQKSREKTYLVWQFVDFIALVLFFRAFFPMFTNYLAYSLRSDEHPHYRIFRLFLGSQVDVDHPDPKAEEKKLIGPLQKLRSYIAVNDADNGGSQSREHLIIGAGLSDDDVTDYLAAESILNKLLTMDFFRVTAKPISHVYQSVLYDGSFRSAATNNLKIKGSVASSPDEDYSHYENYRKTTSLAMGTVVELQFSLRNDRAILTSLGMDPNLVDSDFYKNEMTFLPSHLAVPLDDMRVILLGWFLKDVVNPRALFYIEHRRVVELLLLVKTCLYHTGQEYIGSFLSSHYDKTSSFINSNVIVKGSLSKDLVADLERLFSFSINDKGLVYEQVTIDVSKTITNLPWKTKGYNDPQFVNNDGYLLSPNNITEVVVDYIKYTLKK